ncbi:hypothetical protein ABEG18_13955 [Alsobacter sp. KACC 23698]|uniref:Phosphate starvation-inducible protein PsiF n=1 Tax=Alsobacter sp. KACC 23698 TaxID=3149229 RepID=A0AAU7J9L5_9HYPH
MSNTRQTSSFIALAQAAVLGCAAVLAAGSALAQDRVMPAPSTQSPQAAQGGTQQSGKMSGQSSAGSSTETTGSVAATGDTPKAGLDADCKATLAQQGKKDRAAVEKCGQKAE